MPTGEYESPGEHGEPADGAARGADLTGRLLGGRYRVTGPLGRGGMGVVCRAVDEVLGREVAVKVLRAFTDASDDELADLRTRMRREARAAARIRHAGVVTVHDVTDEDGRPVIVMELIEGTSLDGAMDERGPLDPRETARIGAQVMDALDAAHQAGVLHRDVKPGNILLGRDGRVVITDFGIASIHAPDDGTRTQLTRSGELVGSLDYLPPERAQDLAPGPASDVWSLGMTLYAAVEGAAPFRRTSVWSTLTAIVSEPLPEPQRAGPLTPVLRALMAKDPTARPPAAEARDMLRAVAEGRTPEVAGALHSPTERDVRAAGGTPPPGFGPSPGFGPPGGAWTPEPPPAPSPSSSPSPSPSSETVPMAARGRRRAWLAAAVAVALLVAGGATYALFSPGDRNDRTPTANAPGTPTAPQNTSAAPPSRPASATPSGNPGPPASAAPSSSPSTTPSGGAGASCASVGDAKYRCSVWRTADSYTKDFTPAGTLHAGHNYFYCQSDLGHRETYGRWTNTWWAKTDDDSGNTNVYVSAVYLKGGNNDEPVPGLPMC